MLVYDLHTHSSESDGTLSPAELVARAHGCGIHTLALTDHDTTDGFFDADAEAARLGLTLVPGLEVSVTWHQRTVHIVGLKIDPADARLQSGLRRLQETRIQRAHKIAEALQKAGIQGAFAGAMRYARGTSINRTHFARYLVEIGCAQNLQGIYRRYLTRGKPGYVAATWATLEEVIGWITGAGGLAVLAHPIRYRLTGARLQRLLEEFKACGGSSIEVISGNSGIEERHTLARYAQRNQLLASVGSDYHGPETSWNLGDLPALPRGCRPIWEYWDTKRR